MVFVMSILEECKTIWNVLIEKIKTKYPDIYKQKDEQYYTILKHLYISPNTRMNNPQELFQLLNIARKSAIKKSEISKTHALKIRFTLTLIFLLETELITMKILLNIVQHYFC